MPIKICSFNIQFLGASSKRDNEGLAKLLQDEKCDIVIIQELIGPPSKKFLERNHLYKFPPFPEELYPLAIRKKDQKEYGPKESLKAYPNLDPIKEMPRSTEFFEAMDAAGFHDFILSEENTGPNTNHVNTSAAEWWVAFFRRDRVKVAPDLPHGFLSEKRIKSNDFARVPYAFPFRTLDNHFDFVLISVHLTPGDGRKAEQSRAQELEAIHDWVGKNDQAEKDFIVLGDMNIEDRKELDRVCQLPWVSLNENCQPTNTLVKKEDRKPYDQVVLNKTFTTDEEIPLSIMQNECPAPNFEVLNLIEKMAARWKSQHPNSDFPGGDGKAIPYQHDAFRSVYSDHHPVRFILGQPQADDDGLGALLHGARNRIQLFVKGQPY